MEYESLFELSWGSLSCKIRSSLLHREFIDAIANYVATVDTKEWRFLTLDQPKSQFSSAWLVDFMDRERPLKQSNVVARNFKRIIHAFMCGSAKREAGKHCRKVVAGIFYKFAELRHRSNLYPEFRQQRVEIIEIGHAYVQEHPEWRPLLRISTRLQHLPAYNFGDVDQNSVKNITKVKNELPKYKPPIEKKPATSQEQPSQKPQSNAGNNFFQRASAPMLARVPTSSTPVPVIDTKPMVHNNIRHTEYVERKPLLAIKHEHTAETTDASLPETDSNYSDVSAADEQSSLSLVSASANSGTNAEQSRIEVAEQFIVNVAPSEVSQLQTILLTVGAEVCDFHTRALMTGKYTKGRQEMLAKMKELFANHLGTEQPSQSNNSVVFYEEDGTAPPAIFNNSNMSSFGQAPDSTLDDSIGSNIAPPLNFSSPIVVPVGNKEILMRPAAAPSTAAGIEEAGASAPLIISGTQQISSAIDLLVDDGQQDYAAPYPNPPSVLQNHSSLYESFENEPNERPSQLDSCYFRGPHDQSHA